MDAGKLDQRLTIEQRSVTQDASFGSEVVTWSTLATVWGSIKQLANTRKGGDERVAEDIRVLSSRTQIQIRYRSDITSDMRIQWPARSATFQIVGISEIGRRDGLDLSCEQYSV